MVVAAEKGGYVVSKVAAAWWLIKEFGQIFTRRCHPLQRIDTHPKAQGPKARLAPDKPSRIHPTLKCDDRPPRREAPIGITVGNSFLDGEPGTSFGVQREEKYSSPQPATSPSRIAS